MLITGNRSLKGALEDKARRFPNAPFLFFEDAAGGSQSPWTWRQFDGRRRLFLLRGPEEGYDQARRRERVCLGKQHPAVFDAAVVAIPDPMRDQAIKTYVMLKDGAAATGDELIAWCRGRLSAFKVPEVVEFRDAFPRTSVGKIQKHLF